MSGPDLVRSAAGTLRSFIALLPSMTTIVAMLGLAWAVTTFLTGGLRPQTQVELENSKRELADIHLAVGRCDSKLDQIFAALPLASDIAGWEAHFTRLDQRLDEMKDRLTQTEMLERDTRDRLSELSKANPRGTR